MESELWLPESTVEHNIHYLKQIESTSRLLEAIYDEDTSLQEEVNGIFPYRKNHFSYIKSALVGHDFDGQNYHNRLKEVLWIMNGLNLRTLDDVQSLSSAQNRMAYIGNELKNPENQHDEPHFQRLVQSLSNAQTELMYYTAFSGPMASEEFSPENTKKYFDAYAGKTREKAAVILFVTGLNTLFYLTDSSQSDIPLYVAFLLFPYIGLRYSNADYRNSVPPMYNTLREKSGRADTFISQHKSRLVSV